MSERKCKWSKLRKAIDKVTYIHKCKKFVESRVAKDDPEQYSDGLSIGMAAERLTAVTSSHGGGDILVTKEGSPTVRAEHVMISGSIVQATCAGCRRVVSIELSWKLWQRLPWKSSAYVPWCSTCVKGANTTHPIR